MGTVDIAAAAESSKQQMFEQNIEERRREAEEREQKKRIADMNASIRAQESAYTRKAREEEEKRLRSADKERMAREKAEAAESSRKAKVEDEKRRRHEQFEADRISEKYKRENEKQKAAEAERIRRDKAQAKITSDAMAVKAKQEAQDRAAEERRNAASKAASEKSRAAEEDILRSTKTTSAQRIAARNRIDAMTRAENKRIEDANARITQPNKFRAPDMKKITPSTIRESISSAAGRAPTKVSNITTGIFGGIADTMIQQPSNKGFTKFYKQESQAMSKAVKGHAKMPVTGGKVTPVLKGTQVAVAPGYIDALLGRGGTVRTHTKKSGGVFSGLDNFVRRI